MSVFVRIVCVFFMLMFGGIYGLLKGKIDNRVLIFKALATFMAVLTAVYEAFQNTGMVSWLLVGAAVFCMAADVLLELWIIAGVIAFGTAHILFISAFSMQCTMKWYTAVIFVGMYLVFLIGLGKHLPKVEKMNQKKKVPDRLFKVGACLYPVLLCGTTALAVTVAVQSVQAGNAWKGRSGIAAGGGGILFMISDYLLAWRKLGEKRERRIRFLVLLFYYSAVYLLVW